MKLKLYVEGGGNSKVLRRACAKGFRLFMERAGLAGQLPRIVACGSRHQAYDRFSTSHAFGEDLPVLLVDAEGQVATGSPWSHLKAQDGWVRPDGATDDQCHLMVQIMESWFLADAGSLASFYGQGFQGSALAANPQVEQVPKAKVLSLLIQATRKTQKGSYDKGPVSFEILGAIDPATVETVAPLAKRFLDFLRGPVSARP